MDGHPEGPGPEPGEGVEQHELSDPSGWLDQHHMLDPEGIQLVA
jgi:hypothetical protein